jgi:hypothetical protein
LANAVLRVHLCQISLVLDVLSTKRNERESFQISSLFRSSLFRVVFEKRFQERNEEKKKEKKKKNHKYISPAQTRRDISHTRVKVTFHSRLFLFAPAFRFFHFVFAFFGANKKRCKCFVQIRLACV